MPSFCAARARFNLALSPLLCLIGIAATSPAQAMQPIANGGFETGNFNGWHVETHQAANLIPQSGAVVTGSTTAPYSGFIIPSPVQGNFNAVIDSPSLSSTEMTQIISLPKAAQVTLSFSVSLISQATLQNPQSLNYSDPNVPNQQVRVDILKSNAAATSMDSADILATPLSGTWLPTNGSGSLVTYDLTALAGKTVKLRIASVNSLARMVVSVDNLKISPSAGYWTITDLGVSAATSVGLGLNSAGQVVGAVSPSGSTLLQPFVWDPANGMTLLTSAPGTQLDSRATAINNSSQIAYSAATADQQTHAYLRAADGSSTDLLQSLSSYSSEAHAVNGAGTVVGSFIPTNPATYVPKQAFQWSAASGASALLPNAATSEANGINAAGEIVGEFSAANSYQTHAYSWTAASGLTDLDGPNNTSISGAYGVNASGTVVGYRTIDQSGNNHAVSWTASGSQDLGTASPNYPETVAYAVNNSGTIVGEGSNRQQLYGQILVPNSGYWAMSWKNGMPTALSTVLPADTGWNLLTARGINDSGQIAGTGMINGQYHAYLLSPPTDDFTGNVIVNGGFETGDFSNWNATISPAYGNGGYDYSEGWYVANWNNGYNHPSLDPIDGYTAFNELAGFALDPITYALVSPSNFQYVLSQPFTLTSAPTSATLQFTYNVENANWYGTIPRMFYAELWDTGGNRVATLYTDSFQSILQPHPRVVTLDVASVLSNLGAGSYSLVFRQTVPEPFISQSMFAIDDIGLYLNAPAPTKTKKLASATYVYEPLFPQSNGQIRVTLTSPAVAGPSPFGSFADGQYVQLTDPGFVANWYNTTVANDKNYVFIPSGATSADVSFYIGDSGNQSGNLYVNLNDESIALPIHITDDSVQSVTLSPSAAYSGETLQATVALNGPAQRSYDPDHNLVAGDWVNVSFSENLTVVDGVTSANGSTFVYIPAGQTTATIDLIAPSVTSSTTADVFAYLGTSGTGAEATVDPYPTPVLTSLSPNLIAPTPNPVTLTINGTGFTNETQVLVFGGMFTPSSVTPTQLVVTLPANIAATAGTVNISVSNPTAGSSNTLPLTVTNAVVSSVKVSTPSTTAPTAVTGTVTLTAVAPMGGEPVALSSSSSAATVPASVIVPAGKNVATFTITPSTVDSDTTATITATTGSVSKTAALTAKAAVLTTLTAPAAVNGGTSATVTVTLSGFAGPSGVIVALSSSDATIAPGTSITVAPGAKSGTLTIHPAAVSADKTIMLTATQGGVVKTATVTVKAPVLTSLVAAPSPLAGGATLTVKATISSPAPASGFSVPFTSSSPAVPQGTVSIPAGATSGSAAVVTTVVGNDTAVTLTSVVGAVTKTASVTVQGATLKILTVPASLYGGTTGAVIVSLTGKAGSSGVTIGLSSSDGTTITPGTTITVPSGAITASLSITPTAVAADKTITITATQAAIVKTAPLLVKAAVLTGLTVSANPIAGGGTLVVKAALSSPAPAGGLSVPYTSTSASVPSGTIPVAAGATTGSLSVVTLTVDVDTTTTLTATLGSVSKTAAVTVQAAQLKAIAAPSTVYGGMATTLTVALTGKAGPSGVTVALSSSDGTTIVPGTTFIVPAGALSASLAITPTPVAADTSITFTATKGAIVKTAAILVKAPVISLFTALPNPVKGVHPTTLTITLNAPAPAGGVTIPLTSASAVITPSPAYITVAAGAKTGTLIVIPSTVTANTAVVVTGTLNGVSKTVSVTVTP